MKQVSTGRPSGSLSTITNSSVSTSSTGGQSVQFSGWFSGNEGDSVIKSQQPKRFQRIRNLGILLKYFKQPESRRLLKGMVYHYGLPAAVGFSLLTPVGWVVAPVTVPTSWLLSRRGGKVLDKMMEEGKLSAKKGPLEAVAGIRKTWEQELKTVTDSNAGKTVLDEVIENINKTKEPGKKITKEMLKQPHIEREVMEVFIKRQSGIIVGEYNDIVTEMLKMAQKENAANAKKAAKVSPEELRQMRTFLHARPNGRLRRKLNFILEAKHTVKNTMLGRIASPFRRLAKPKWVPKPLRWPLMGVALFLQGIAVITRSPTIGKFFKKSARL